MSEFTLPYGSGSVRFSLPSETRFLGRLVPRNVPALTSFKDSFIVSLREPIASKTLREVCNPGEKVALLVSDVTRRYKTEVFLSWLLNELNLAGIEDDDIFIVFARGAHRPHAREEQVEILGREVARRVSFREHDCHNREELSYVGTTSSGTEVRLNKGVIEADRCILTGLIEYHYYAGFTGGRKSILPGIASYETIQQNHRLLFKPGSTTGRLKGNPVHEDMLEAAKMLKPDFLVNLVLNAAGDVAGIFTGDCVEAHLEGCRFVEKIYGREIPHRADMVIASPGGYPKDINYYQAHKALDNAFHAVREGGVIILLAECREGLGHEKFNWFKYSAAGAKEKLLEEFDVVGHNVYSTLRKAENAEIILVSSLPEKLSKHLPFYSATDVEDAIDLAMELLDESPTVYIMPRAYSTFPITTDGRER